MLELYNEMLVSIKGVIGFETRSVVGFVGDLEVSEAVQKIRSKLTAKIQVHKPGKEDLSHDDLMRMAENLLSKKAKLAEKFRNVSLDLSDMLSDSNMPIDLNYKFEKHSNAVGFFTSIIQEDVPQLTPDEKFELLFYDPRNAFFG